MSGLWCVALGYGRKELSDAAYRQMLELPYYNSFFQSTTTPAIELARILTEVTPPQFNHVFYTGSGSEANDTLMRLVRRYWQLLGPARTQRHRFALEWLPRQHHCRRLAGRHEADARAARPGRRLAGYRAHQPALLVRRRRRPHARRVRSHVRARAGSEDPRGRPATRRGVHRRAGAGRRRPGDSARTPIGRRSSGSSTSTASCSPPTRSSAVSGAPASGSAASITERARTS